MIIFTRRISSRRLLLTLALVASCAVIVAACSSTSGSSTSSSEGIRSGHDWAPQNSLAVVSLDISSKGIDTALATLARLPSFHLVTAQLPAPHGGTQAREQLVNMMLNGEGGCGAKPPKTSGYDKLNNSCGSFKKDVAPWLGNEAGLAVLPASQSKHAKQHTPRVVGYIESTDDAKATAFIKKHAKTIKGVKEENGDSLDSWTAKGERGPAIGVSDGAVLIGQSRADLLEVVHAHKDNSTIRGPLADQLTALRKNRQVAAVVDVEAVYTEGLDQLKARTDKNSQRAYQALDVDSLRSWVPQVAGVAFGIDKAGIRADFTYSPASDHDTTGLAEVLQGAPFNATVASTGASSSTGDTAERLSKVWQDEQDKGVIKASDISDLALKCPTKASALCALGTRLALAILDGSAAKAISTPRESGPSLSMSLPGTAPGSTTMFGYMPAPKDGGTELAMREHEWVSQLNTAAKPYGVTFKLAAGKMPGDQTFLAMVSGATLKKAGLNLASPKGKVMVTSLVHSGLGIVRIPGNGLEVSAATSIADGRQYYAFPSARLAPSIAALTKGPHLDSNASLRADLATAALPERLSALAWIDLVTVIENTIAGVAQTSSIVGGTPAGQNPLASPGAKAALGLARLNLAHVGGVVEWSEYDASQDGWGTSHTLIPLYAAALPATKNKW